MTITKDPSKMLELAERCEQATGPDRDTDAAIHTAVTSFEPRVGGVGWPKDALVVPAFPGWKLLPAYTASIDAAMTLVPDGCDFATGSARKNSLTMKRPWAWVTPEDEVGSPVCEGATPALALCAASLRAKAAAQ